MWASVDDRTKTGFLWEFPGATERLQIFKAELLDEGSFDEAVYGVDTVFHTACPVVYDPNGDPQVTLLVFSHGIWVNFLSPPKHSFFVGCNFCFSRIQYLRCFITIPLNIDLCR